MSAQRSASTSPMRALVATIISMISAMSPDDLGPERSVLSHALTATRTVLSSEAVSDHVQARVD
jgi:hypothetical protein